MQRHPVKHELLSYAECLLGGRPIPADLGRHVARCPVCAAEVEAMRYTFRLTAEAAKLEPTRDFTARVLMAAKSERVATQRHRSRMRSALRAAKGLGYAAGLVLASTLWFSAASEVSTPVTLEARASEPAPAAAAEASPEELNKAATLAQMYAAAVGSFDGQPASERELQYRRMALALNEDLLEAWAALERNPGCERASDVVTTTLRRQAKTYQQLYFYERSL